MKDLKNIKFWLFDLDNTLYDGATKVFDQVDKKMSKFISEKLNVNIEEAKKITIDDFKKIKTSFNATQDALDQAEKKLSTGKGNLTNQAKELQDMGARSKKVLSDFDND